MNRILVLSLFTLAFLGVQHQANSGECCEQYAAHHIYVGPDWKHASQNQAVQDPDGSLWGVFLQYEYIRNCSLYFGADFGCAKGTLDDDFNYCIDHDVDVQARFGWTWFTRKCGKCLYVIPYLGLGFRQVEQEFQTEIPYYERYDRYYLPFGFRSSWLLSSCWEVGLNVQARYSLHTEQEHNKISVYFSRNNCWGALIELPITYHFCHESCSGYDVKLVPYWKWDQYGEMKAISSIKKFDYYQAGLVLLVGYRF